MDLPGRRLRRGLPGGSAVTGDGLRERRSQPERGDDSPASDAERDHPDAAEQPAAVCCHPLLGRHPVQCRTL
jgi:hypothetical protein